MSTIKIDPAATATTTDEAPDATATVGSALRSALGLQPLEDDPGEADDEGGSEDGLEEGSAAPDATSSEEGAEEPEEAPPRPRESEPERVPAWKRAAEAKRVAQLKADRAEASSLLEALRKKEAEIQQREKAIASRDAELGRLFAEDPLAAVEKLAQITGRRGQDILADLASRAMHGKPHPKAQEMGELAQVRQQLEELKASLKESQNGALRAFEERRRQEHLQACVDTLMTPKTDPRAAEAFPLLAAMPTPRLQHEVHEIVRWAAAEAPRLLTEPELPKLAELIEQSIEEEFAAIAKARGVEYTPTRAPELSAPSRGRAAPANLADHRRRGLEGAPAEKPKPSAPRQNPITNADQAGAASLTDEQRARAVGQSLRAALKL